MKIEVNLLLRREKRSNIYILLYKILYTLRIKSFFIYALLVLAICQLRQTINKVEAKILSKKKKKCYLYFLIRQHITKIFY